MKIFNKDGTILLNIDVSDESYRYVELMGKDELVLKFALSEFVDIPIGSYCIPDFTGNLRYELMMPTDLSVVNRREFEYTITLEASYGHLKKYRIHNMVDGRLRFDLTATPREHLEQIVRNLQERDSSYGWKIGVCIDESEKLISYDHTTCEDALSTLANTFDTEFEINGSTISLHKVSYNKDNPLQLSYGKGNGFKSGVTRSNAEDSLPVERLFVQGGDRNINKKQYATDASGTNGSSTLLLPADGTKVKFDGSEYKFPTDTGYSSFAGREYVVTNGRKAVIRNDKPLSTKNEDSLDLTEVYPKRVGRISKVRYIYRGTAYKFSELPADVRNGDWNSESLSKILVDFYDGDLNIPDYDACQIAGQQMTIVFQTGMLAGREVNLYKFTRTQSGNVIGKFELQRQELDGVLMPSNVYRLLGDEESGEGKGDEYIVYNCSMPQSYYDEAEIEMLKKAVKYLYEHEEVMFSFKGDLDGVYAKKNWSSISNKIVIGGHVAFKDTDIIGNGKVFDTRIESIKQPVNNPHSPTITLSNEPARTSVASVIKKIEAERVHIEEMYSNSVLYTRRTFKQAMESLAMIEEAFAGGFTESINPVSVRTMSMLVGDESLQFKVFNTDFTQEIALPASFENGRLTINACGIKHYTLEVEDRTLTPTDNTNYLHWQMGSQTLTPEEPSCAYYLYAKVSKSTDTDTSYQLSKTPIALNGEGYYNLLVGILSSVDENDGRSFAPLYGYTEILPNRILTGMIRSADGETYFDLDEGVIHGKIQFTSNSTGLSGLKEFIDLSGEVDKANGSADTANKNAIDAAKAALEASKAASDAGQLAQGAIDGLTNVQKTINEMNDDGVLDINEKHIIRTEWENINGQATTSQIASSSTGTYWAVKRNFKQYTFPTANSTFVYDGVMYTYAQIDIVYNILGLTELDSAYTRLRNYLDSMRLYADIASSNFDRVTMASKFTAYYEAERRVSDNIVVDNKKKVDDLAYLTETLDKYSDNVTDIIGGLILSKIIGVRESNSMVAGLNATDIAKDDTHGKMMMFAGANPNLQTTEAKMNSAKFKVYSDGTMIARGAVLDELSVEDAVMTNVEINGSYRSPFYSDYSNAIDSRAVHARHDNYAIRASEGGTHENPIFLPYSAEMNGRTLFLENYILNGEAKTSGEKTTLKMGRGSMVIAGKDFYLDGHAIGPEITFDNWIMLKGFGEGDTFYGYIVIGLG